MNTIPQNHRDISDRGREAIEAAENKPANVDETNDTKRQSEGTRQPATPSPDSRKFAGAGPAVAERSKDAKAPKGGRQPGAYVKD